jgi:hypothetical protein
MVFDIRFYAFVGLVIIQTGIGGINKIALLYGGGKYTFAPASALAIAEAAKLCISFFLHVQDFEGTRGHARDTPLREKVKAAVAHLFEVLDMNSIFQISTLAFLYCFNNQLSFFINGGADPGSIFLFKSGSTVITAVLLRVVLGRQIAELQWAAICMQVFGLVVTEWNPCEGRPLLPDLYLMLMTFSTCCTATAAVRNDYMLKNFALSMHVQNIVMYAAGAVMNACAFALLPAYLTNARDDVGFFDGYDNPSACMVVLFNALIGLAISSVYKYADAVVKTFATATVTVNLVILSSLYGLQQPSVVAWMGVLVVVTATAMYGRITSLRPRESTASSPHADRDAGGEECGGGKDGGQEVELLLPAAGLV